MGQPLSATLEIPEDSSAGRARLRHEVRAFADAQGRRPRVMIARHAPAGEDDAARLMAAGQAIESDAAGAHDVLERIRHAIAA